ncbi:polysaccharide/polyol phosphate ABC transporter permease protein [methanogenic archaeon ISO4-H5]|nr:polysaccharide/polyol phosphate ABC transporter permease protein [methanogenic archaeon ISO4-H5]
MKPSDDAYWSMLTSFIVKNISGQYKYSSLGIIWQILTPFITVILFYGVFTSLRLTTDENYWLLLCSGLFVFEFINRSINSGSMCIINNASIIKKVRFPRELIPISFVLSSLLTMVITYSLVIIISIIVKCELNLYALILLIPITLITTTFTIGLTLLLSSICVYVRDFAYAINAGSRLLFWITPVLYTVSSIEGALSIIIWINPITPFVTIFQTIIYYGELPSVLLSMYCVGLSIILMLLGWIVFKKLNRGFMERL